VSIRKSNETSNTTGAIKEGAVHSGSQRVHNATVGCLNIFIKKININVYRYIILYNIIYILYISHCTATVGGVKPLPKYPAYTLYIYIYIYISIGLRCMGTTQFVASRL